MKTPLRVYADTSVFGGCFEEKFSEASIRFFYRVMKPIKDFHCVQMKWDIQQKLLEEERLLGREEAHRKQDERVRMDPILGPFLRRLEEREQREAKQPR